MGMMECTLTQHQTDAQVRSSADSHMIADPGTVLPESDSITEREAEASRFWGCPAAALAEPCLPATSAGPCLPCTIAAADGPDPRHLAFASR